MSPTKPPSEPAAAPLENRLIGFSDGVVAIAITVIILPLVDSARSFGSGPTIDFLRSNVFNLEAAGLSFVVIASFWVEHRALYRTVRDATAALVHANLLWLAAIVFLPLPTVLIVDSPGHDRVALALYIGTILVADIAARLQELVIDQRHLSLRPAPTARSRWASWVGALLTCIAMLIAVVFPAVGLYPLLLLLLSRPAAWFVARVGATDRRRARPLAPASDPD